ncbi:hypothetical protein I3843_14G129500 [Carya illinoinensis]|nr:hypothetical protein I3843_14G129500 [Carya illinoinensis]
MQHQLLLWNALITSAYVAIFWSDLSHFDD